MTDPRHEARRRRLARNVLTRHAGLAVDATAVATATSRAYDDLAQVLAPVIGDVGVAAMTDRALHLATREYPHGTAFLTDAIIMQRYIELQGQLQRVMAVVKVRGSADSKDLRAFEITRDGIVMGDALAGYEGLLTGRPEAVG